MIKEEPNIIVKDVMISRNIAFERVKQLKTRYVKGIEIFLALIQFIYGMVNREMSQEVGCLNLLVPHFFIDKKISFCAF